MEDHYNPGTFGQLRFIQKNPPPKAEGFDIPKKLILISYPLLLRPGCGAGTVFGPSSPVASLRSTVFSSPPSSP